MFIKGQETMEQCCKKCPFLVLSMLYAKMKQHILLLCAFRYITFYLFYSRVISTNHCGTLQCNGMLQQLIVDLDGTFLGAAGAIVPQSDFEWGVQVMGSFHNHG